MAKRLIYGVQKGERIVAVVDGGAMAAGAMADKMGGTLRNLTHPGSRELRAAFFDAVAWMAFPPAPAAPTIVGEDLRGYAARVRDIRTEFLFGDDGPGDSVADRLDGTGPAAQHLLAALGALEMAAASLSLAAHAADNEESTT